MGEFKFTPILFFFFLFLFLLFEKRLVSLILGYNLDLMIFDVREKWINVTHSSLVILTRVSGTFKKEKIST